MPVSVQDYYDWEKITGLLAGQEPLFPPGTASGYQAITFGYLAGEVIRRITGQSCGQFFASEIAGPLGADFHIGLAEAELGRCCELQGVRPSEDEQAALAQAYANAHPAARAALLNPALTGDEANAGDCRMAQIPSANGHGTAPGLAMIFRTPADGSERLTSAGTHPAARGAEALLVGVFAAGRRDAAERSGEAPSPSDSVEPSESRWGGGLVHLKTACLEASPEGPARAPSQLYRGRSAGQCDAARGRDYCRCMSGGGR